MIDCDFCNMPFEKGTGHLCWCKDCSKVHPMCNPCYEECIENGTIVDKVIKRNSVTPENMEKYA